MFELLTSLSTTSTCTPASVISKGRCQCEDTAPVTHQDQEQGDFPR
jgi:hypothetical protein